MGLMKSINTAFHNGGSHAFDHLTKLDRSKIRAILAARHEAPRRQEVIGDFVVILGHVVKEPNAEGEYIVFDSLTDGQQLVTVHQANQDWFCCQSGSSLRFPLARYNQPYYRWIRLHPLTKEILSEVRKL